MAHPLQVDSEQTGVLLNELVREHGAGRVIDKADPRTGRPRHKTPGAIAFVLLEDLDSGGTAQSFVLRKTDLPVQIVTLKGNVTGGSFRLHYGTPVVQGGPEASGAITYDATAAEMKAALEEIESIGPGGVGVGLGKATYLNAAGVETEVITGRWLLEFLKLSSPELLTPFEVSGGDELTGSPNLIETTTHFLKLTDRQEKVYSTIPVGVPTPQKIGAIGQALWLHGIGYSVDSIECRDFDQTAAAATTTTTAGTTTTTTTAAATTTTSAATTTTSAATTTTTPP